MLKGIPLLGAALLVLVLTGCNRPGPEAGTPTPAATLSAARTRAPSPSPTVAFTPSATPPALAPSSSPTRISLRERAEASRKAKAAKKAAEAKQLAAEMRSSSSAKDLLLWLPLNGSVEDRGPLGSPTSSREIVSCPGREGTENGGYQFGQMSSISVEAVKSFNNLDQFTLCAWVGPTGTGEHLNIISKVTPGRDFNLQLNSGGHVVTHIENNGYEFASTAGALPQQEWTFVAATFKDRTWRLYLNGELDATVKVSKVPGWTGELLTVGNLYPGAPEGFQGSLDDVRIYRRALEQPEIQVVMQAKP